MPEFLFVCIGPTCGERGGHALVRAWKEGVIDRRLWARLRVVPAHCFGQCATGPNACLLRAGRFLAGIDLEHADAVLTDVLTTALAPPA